MNRGATVFSTQWDVSSLAAPKPTKPSYCEDDDIQKRKMSQEDMLLEIASIMQPSSPQAIPQKTNLYQPVAAEFSSPPTRAGNPIVLNSPFEHQDSVGKLVPRRSNFGAFPDRNRAAMLERERQREAKLNRFRSTSCPTHFSVGVKFN